jgi:hypothetical protein
MAEATENITVTEPCQLAVVDTELPGDPRRDLVQNTTGADLVRGAIVELRPTTGIFQLWNERFVPITDETYREHVAQCPTAQCGRCGWCVTELEFFRHQRAATDKLGRGIEDAVDSVVELQRFAIEITSGSASDIDLRAVDADDLRGTLRDAARNLRSALRIAAMYARQFEDEMVEAS